MNEELELKQKIIDCLDRHFKISKEVEGEYVFEEEKRKVFADLLIEPKEILINEYDLPKGKYIIEIKSIKNISIPDISNLFIQCLTYRNSKFNNEFPVGVFIYTNLDYIFHPETKDSRMLEIMFCTFGRLNIGRIEIMNNDFTFYLHKGDILFRYKNGEYKKTKRNLLSISFGSGNNKLLKQYK